MFLSFVLQYATIVGALVRHPHEEDDLEMHVLVAFEEDYRAYRDALASTLRALRPHLEVTDVGLDELEAEEMRFAPDLLICSRSKSAPDTVSRVRAWLKLPTRLDRWAELCLNGEYSALEAPGLNEVLRIVDETENLVRARPTPRYS